MKKMSYIPIGVGMVGGMLVGLFMAPKSGKELRKDMENFLNKMDSCDMKNKIKDISDDLKKIDKEEILEEVKKQVKKVNKKIDKLMDCDFKSDIKDIGENIMESMS